MKRILFVSVLAMSLMLALSGLSAALAETAGSAAGPAAEGFSLETETFGPLRVGMTEKELREIPGEWVAMGEPMLWGADGMEHWDLFCAQYGVQVGLARDPGTGSEAAVYSIFATAPCEWKTSRGIGIGDMADILKALYQDAIDLEEVPESEETVLIGSLYGGILAGVQEGLITSLFLGAMAE